MKREDLSPEEREEYDDILAESGIDEYEQRRESQEIGPRMHSLLEDAYRAGRPWAGYVIEDDAEAGHLVRFKQWDKARRRIRVVAGDVIVPRAAVVGVRRRREDGSTYYQQSFWQELSWAEVEQKLTESTAQMNSAKINAATARRLLALRELAPTSTGPTTACLLLGLDFEAYLAGEQDIA